MDVVKPRRFGGGSSPVVGRWRTGPGGRRANEPERLQRIRGATEMVKLQTLSEVQQVSSDTASDGRDTTPADVVFPDFGRTDFDV